MKKSIICLVAFLSISLSFNSCSKDEVSFDETLLIGKWQEGTLFEKYLSDGTGSTWDTKDDVTEAEAQKFTWTLVKADLTQIYIMESSNTKVPKYYTVTALTSTSLKYKDDFGVTHSFTKVSK
jgi:hypothetical protein